MRTTSLSRRRFLTTATSLAALSSAQAARPRGYLVDWTHMFGDDRQRFPYHKYALNQAAPKPVESYSRFVREAGIDRCVIIHSEVYQDDHRYLEYCFEHEPSPGFFKATCLFDPVATETPARIEQFYRKYPSRIIGMRINVQNEKGTPPSTSGGVRNRDMRHPNMKKTWAKLAELGLGVEMQSLPCWTPIVRELKLQFPNMPLQIDHYGQPARGTEAEFEQVLDLAKLPRVYMRVEPLGGGGGAAQNHWFEPDQIVRKVWDAFGPDHLLWAGFGSDMKSFEQRLTAIDHMFAFASEEDRAKIRGDNAMKLFNFPMS
jgi:predicted TIM-barrel fold metal-dependent hydrolase